MAEIAEALKEFKEQMVFVGGAVVSLYTNDPAADEIRPTQDVDMTLDIVGITNWEKVRGRLAELGFHLDTHANVICRYKYKNIPVDIIGSEDSPMGPANSWYKIGLEDVRIGHAKDQEIRILSAPCYLATKFEAFHNRGKDYRTSHDIEDIFYIIDNRIEIVEEIQNADIRIKNYLIEQFKLIRDQGMMDELFIAHIHPLVISQRLPLVQEKINRMLTL